MAQWKTKLFFHTEKENRFKKQVHLYLYNVQKQEVKQSQFSHKNTDLIIIKWSNFKSVFFVFFGGTCLI